VTDNVERQLAAERRGWIFEFAGPAAPPTQGQQIITAQATLIDVLEDEHKGHQFIGQGDDPLGDLLAQIEAFDQKHKRL